MDYLGLSGTIWDNLGLSGTILVFLGLSGIISDYLRLSGTIWDYRELSGAIGNYLGLSQTSVQVEARESKLLIFGNFLVFFFLIFTCTSCRGARAPKKIKLL